MYWAKWNQTHGPNSVISMLHATHGSNLISIFKRCVTAEKVCRARLPEVILRGGMSPDREKYLYTQVRPFVRPEFQNIPCPLLF